MSADNESKTGDTHLFPGAMAFDAGRTTHIGAYEDLAASRYERAKKRENRSAAPRKRGTE